MGEEIKYKYFLVYSWIFFIYFSDFFGGEVLFFKFNNFVGILGKVQRRTSYIQINEEDVMFPQTQKSRGSVIQTLSQTTKKVRINLFC